MRLRSLPVVLPALGALLLAPAPAAAGGAPTGAIFTTDVNGSQVNANLFDAKTDVYLDGGPGIAAPQTAAGLDDGTYVFMVTDPSAKKLLSEDAAQCREFTVSGGIITGVVPAGGCEHATGVDQDHNAVTVQLFPFSNTPNPGGVYKAWAMLVSNYPASCLATVDCAIARHGFTPSLSKTDNFKVRSNVPREIDTQFFNDLNGDGEQQPNEPFLSFMQITWTDTLGASNVKWSDPATSLEAHVEAVENGTHQIAIANQSGCAVGLVQIDNVDHGVGPETVSITLSTNDKDASIHILVACTVT
jgi:hypothetical protein